jgi:zinc protease
VFAVGAMVRPEKDPKEVERVLLEEIEQLKTELVKESEMDKVQMQVKSYTVGRLESTLERARMLGFYTVFYNDPGLINSLAARYAAVTREQIQAMSKKYLTDANRTVITTVPKAAAGKAAAAAGKER